MNETRQIYVASLSDYNNGRLHGAWIDCEGKSADELADEVAEMLRASKYGPAEEYAIHDTEGFGNLVGEYTPLSDVAAICEALESADNPAALLAYAEHMGEHDIASLDDQFQEAYQGEWNSIEDYAESFIDDTGLLADVPENLRYYFDTEKYARDMMLGGDIFTVDAPDGGVFVFWNH